MEEQREGSTNGHTAGPWHVEMEEPVDYPVLDKHCLIGTGRGTPEEPFRHVADAGYAGNAEARANARLIAAAPELLAACKLALARLRCEYDDPAQVEARDALVKAVARAGGR